VEVDASKGLGAGEAADDEPGLRVNHRGGQLAVGSDRQFPAGEVAYQQAMVQRLPGPDGCGAIQLDVCLARVERLTGRLPGEWAGGRVRLAVRGIGQIAHREEHVVAETPVQIFGSRESRRGEPDLERRLDALATGIRKLEQRARLLAHEMAESLPQFVPDRHGEHATHAAAAWLMSRALDPQPGAATAGCRYLEARDAGTSKLRLSCLEAAGCRYLEAARDWFSKLRAAG
jgi:hypothetical protein